MSDDEAMDMDHEMDVDDFEDFEDFEEPLPAPIPSSSGPPKGRKRFLADLEEMKKLCVVGFGYQGYHLRSTFKNSRFSLEPQAMLSAQ